MGHSSAYNWGPVNLQNKQSVDALGHFKVSNPSEPSTKRKNTLPIQKVIKGMGRLDCSSRGIRFNSQHPRGMIISN